MATVKTFLVAASCGMVLLSAVSAHAYVSLNKIAANKLSSNKLAGNGINLNTLTTPASSSTTLGTSASDGLPLHVISHHGLGKPVGYMYTP